MMMKQQQQQQQHQQQGKRKCQQGKLQQQPSSYLYQDDYRFVCPYEHCYRLRVTKDRMVGQTIWSLYTTEFIQYDSIYYGEVIDEGLLRINGKQVKRNTIVQYNDLIEHYVHRHEPPIYFPNTLTTTSTTTTTSKSKVSSLILYETDDIIIVNKPSTIPVHPCGVYNYNSLLSILTTEYFSKQQQQQLLLQQQQQTLHVVHRLDRLTSGIVIFAKNKKMARQLDNQFRTHQFQKSYLARIKGSLLPYVTSLSTATTSSSSTTTPTTRIQPLSPHIQMRLKKDPIQMYNYNNNNDICSSNADNNEEEKNAIYNNSNNNNNLLIEVIGAIRCVSSQKNYQDCHPDGQSATTYFRHIKEFSNDGTSLVECIPITGRKHQIRVHLQALGIPIVNDPIYNNNTATITTDATTTTTTTAITESNQDTNLKHLSNPFNENNAITSNTNTINNNKSQLEEETTITATTATTKSKPSIIQKVCPTCKDSSNGFSSSHIYAKGIYLHSLKYSCKEWSVTTPWPEWALAE